MAADEGHEAADAAVESFLRDARQTYREAQEDAGKALRSFLAGFEAEDAERRADVAAGRLAEDEYREWRRGRMLTGRRYRATLDQVAWCYTHANEVAMAALSGRLPEVFAENYNYGTYQVEAAALVDTTFALQDASTAQTLLADRDAYLPKPKVDEGRDRAWNRRLVSSQLAQGVALGEGIPDIAARIARVTGSNVAAATRAARTSVTAAECAGRVESYRRAQGMGVRLGQEWLATLDERTRSSHRQLDGERVEVGGKFSNGCRYPGDPQAPYSETCNCRCTLVAAVDGVDQSGAKRWSRLPEGMTYEQWKATKPAVSGPVPANRTISEFMDMPGTRRKLDVAGVSATEARRLLTEQLREYGIPSGSFRRMSAGDQQSVFDGALARIMGVRDGAKLDSIGGSIPEGLSSSRRTKKMARGMAKRLGECDDAGVRELFKRFGQQLRVMDERGHGAWFNPENMRVEMRVAEAIGGDSSHKPYQIVFHEFGHMIDWLAGRGSGYASASSGIVEAIERDWKKLRISAVVESYELSGRKNAIGIIRDLRSFGTEIGDDSLVRLARDLRDGIRHGVLSYDGVIARDDFNAALRRMAEHDIDEHGYMRSEADKLIIDKLIGRGARKAKRVYGDASDIIEGITGMNFPLGVGRGEDYFSGDGRHALRATEFFAEVCSAKVVNADSLEVISELFPEALGKFDELVKEITR